MPQRSLSWKEESIYVTNFITILLQLGCLTASPTFSNHHPLWLVSSHQHQDKTLHQQKMMTCWSQTSRRSTDSLCWRRQRENKMKEGCWTSQTHRTRPQHYSASKGGKDDSKGDSEIIRAAILTTGPECMGQGARLLPPQFQRETKGQSCRDTAAAPVGPWGGTATPVGPEGRALS